MKVDQLGGSLLALCAIAFWSTNAMVAHWLLEAHQLSNIQTLQFVGATLVFLFIGRKGKRPAKRVLLNGACVGVLGLVGTMVFQYIAFANAPVIQANIIAYSWPLLLALVHVFVGRSSRPVFLIGSAVAGFIGVSLVSGLASSSAVFSPLGYGAAATSAICMASYSFLVGTIEVEPRDVLLPASLLGVVGCLVWSTMTGLSSFSVRELVAGLYLGCGPMGLGYVFWSVAMKHDATGRVSVFGYLTPVCSSLLLWFTGSYLSAIAFFGAAIVVLSCLFVGWEQTRESTPHSQSHKAA